MQLTPEQLDRLAKAGCKVPLLVYPASIGRLGDPPRDTYGQPTESAVMEWLAGKTGMIVLLSLTPPGLLPERYSPWEVSAYKPGRGGVPADRRFGKDPLHALYALALAVGAVKDGTQ